MDAKTIKAHFGATAEQEKHDLFVFAQLYPPAQGASR